MVVSCCLPVFLGFWDFLQTTAAAATGCSTGHVTCRQRNKKVRENKVAKECSTGCYTSGPMVHDFWGLLGHPVLPLPVCHVTCVTPCTAFLCCLFSRAFSLSACHVTCVTPGTAAVQQQLFLQQDVCKKSQKPKKTGKQHDTTIVRFARFLRFLRFLANVLQAVKSFNQWNLENSQL